MNGWRRGPGGVLRFVGSFPEVDERELSVYAFTAVPIAERQHPSCGKPGTGRSVHRRHGEPACEVCRRAEAEYTARRREAATPTAAQGLADGVADALE